MRVQGTIQSIVPDGGYQGTNGYINTFQMTVQSQDGNFTGQIGSKSQNYPANVGDEIIIEVTNSDYGPRFKKINPQYQQQNNQGGQQQQPQGQRQHPQQAPQKSDSVQLYIIRQSSIRSAVEAYKSGEPNLRGVLDMADAFVKYVMNGQKEVTSANNIPSIDNAPPSEYEQGDTVPF